MTPRSLDSDAVHGHRETQRRSTGFGGSEERKLILFFALLKVRHLFIIAVVGTQSGSANVTLGVA